MPPSISTQTPFTPSSPDERELVRAELAEVLKSPQFSNSKRYPALLSHIVEETLAGRSDELKERVLGVEVFRRPADYDTNNDTVVRVAAGEVRKRLALIYHENSTGHAVQISLPSGSYVPEFSRLTPLPEVVAPTLTVEETALPAAAPATKSARIYVLLAVAVLLITGLLLFLHSGLDRRDSVSRFWEPLESTGAPVLISPGALVSSASTPYGMALAGRKDDYPFTSMATSVAMANLVSTFSRTHTPYLVQPTPATTLDDLRHHPVVLIGAYNNEWTPRLQDDLRYRFAPDPARQIVDSTQPSTIWMRPKELPLREEADYAIVARFRSRLTDNYVVLLAGIGKNGTEAASEFVTSPRYLDLLKLRSQDWVGRNVEIVLKIGVVDGKNAAPTIEAINVW